AAAQVAHVAIAVVVRAMGVAVLAPGLRAGLAHRRGGLVLLRGERQQRLAGVAAEDLARKVVAVDDRVDEDAVLDLEAHGSEGDRHALFYCVSIPPHGPSSGLSQS